MPRAGRANIAFTDLTVNSACDDLFPGVEDVDAQATLQLRAALDAFEEGVYEHHNRPAPAVEADGGAKAGGKGRRRNRREEAYARRIPEDRQCFRPVDQQSAEWAAFKPHMWLRGRQIATTDQHPSSPQHRHHHQHHPHLHHQPGTAFAAPHAADAPAPPPAADAAAAPPPGAAGGSAPPFAAAAAPGAPAGELCVVGRRMRLQEPAPGAQPEGGEEVLAACPAGGCEDTLLVQHDEWEGAVPEALRRRRGRPRDEKAVAIGLPPQEPASAVLYDVAEELLPEVWARLAPLLAPLLRAMAEERRNRPASSGAAAFGGGGGGRRGGGGNFEIITFSSSGEEEAVGADALLGGSDAFGLGPPMGGMGFGIGVGGLEDDEDGFWPRAGGAGRVAYVDGDDDEGGGFGSGPVGWPGGAGGFPAASYAGGAAAASFFGGGASDGSFGDAESYDSDSESYGGRAAAASLQPAPGSGSGAGPGLFLLSHPQLQLPLAGPGGLLSAPGSGPLPPPPPEALALLSLVPLRPPAAPSPGSPAPPSPGPGPAGKQPLPPPQSQSQQQQQFQFQAQQGQGQTQQREQREPSPQQQPVSGVSLGPGPGSGPQPLPPRHVALRRIPSLGPVGSTASLSGSGYVGLPGGGVEAAAAGAGGQEARGTASSLGYGGGLAGGSAHRPSGVRSSDGSAASAIPAAVVPGGGGGGGTGSGNGAAPRSSGAGGLLGGAPGSPAALLGAGAGSTGAATALAVAVAAAAANFPSQSYRLKGGGWGGGAGGSNSGPGGLTGSSVAGLPPHGSYAPGAAAAAPPPPPGTAGGVTAVPSTLPPYSSGGSGARGGGGAYGGAGLLAAGGSVERLPALPSSRSLSTVPGVGPGQDYFGQAFGVSRTLCGALDVADVIVPNNDDVLGATQQLVEYVRSEHRGFWAVVKYARDTMIMWGSDEAASQEVRTAAVELQALDAAPLGAGADPADAAQVLAWLHRSGAGGAVFARQLEAYMAGTRDQRRALLGSDVEDAHERVVRSATVLGWAYHHGLRLHRSGSGSGCGSAAPGLPEALSVYGHVVVPYSEPSGQLLTCEQLELELDGLLPAEEKCSVAIFFTYYTIVGRKLKRWPLQHSGGPALASGLTPGHAGG
ncbi:hypothetical protein GPECTOR_113g287 [Gonium pectorale]|uniref:Uncharacterized protein n=1 Tax=Gonium pectorale TaxID=33097 RepID=A0A150G089_GONPE|nr:hypothetical protein GPECTOR_113g287 [Gonium pectorale]|eukprot:KXZ42875.1 hypothetical protein GPECTOR_113g287 [Gonium pectorale]